MARVTIDDILSQKFFYRDNLRRAAVGLLFSIVVNAALLGGIFFELVTKKESKFYASNAAGAGFILELSPMAQPNMSDQALLPPDPPEEVEIKTLDL